MNILYLTIDAFGGKGGIAQYNRYALQAISSLDRVDKIIAVPRVVPLAVEEMPDKIKYCVPNSNSQIEYIRSVIANMGKVDLIICAHVNLLQVAVPVSLWQRCPIVTLTYGIECWTASGNKRIDFLARYAGHVVSIRKYSYERFASWAKLKSPAWSLITNCVDKNDYHPAPRNPKLVSRYELGDRPVIMTAGRLDPAMVERFKGFDEMIELLPRLKEKYPDILYLIVGDGDDKPRLVEKATELEVLDSIKFTGWVPEEEKIDHYRLASAFVMVGRNPQFDTYPLRFVLLEALACGTPFVASMPHGDGEADTYGMDAARFVDPNDEDAVFDAVDTILDRKPTVDLNKLAPFYLESMTENFAKVINQVCPPKGA